MSHSTVTIRDKALDLLARAGVRGPSVPVEDIARILNADIRRRPYEGDFSGMVMRVKEGWVIGVNSLDAPVRQRFTIAHEIGHICLHPEDDFHSDEALTVRFRNAKSSKGIDELEIDANRFAAELLMPVPWLKKSLAGRRVDALLEDGELISSLASEYEVSSQAMTIRLGSVMLWEDP